MGFQRFYETWFEQLRNLVHQLIKAPRPATTQEECAHHHHLIDKAISHFSDYYRVKTLAVKQDVLSIFAAPWCTAIERSLHWIAGWRPTTAFHLVYTESSILFESNITDIFSGLRTGDLGDLTPSQFSRLSELQCETVQQENSLTDELSKWQLELGASDVEVKCLDVEKKIEGLVRIVEKADDLRLGTIRKVSELLTPQQSLEFLIVAAELQFGIRGWGNDHERRN